MSEVAPALALGLYLAGLVTAFGVRSWIHRRRTGSLAGDRAPGLGPHDGSGPVTSRSDPPGRADLAPAPTTIAIHGTGPKNSATPTHPR